MRAITNVAALPSVPAVYAMCGGRGAALYAAYAGVADNLKVRLLQHLVRRSSSVTTGTAVALNVEYVTEVRWLEHPDSGKLRVVVFGLAESKSDDARY